MYVGAVWKPRFQVLDDDNETVITADELGGTVTVFFIKPSGDRTAPVNPAPDPDVDDAWRTPIELDEDGEWVCVGESPAPFKDVEVARVYADVVT